MKRRIFLVCLFYCFLDCRSTNLLRLFSGNLPAMLVILCVVDFSGVATSLTVTGLDHSAVYNFQIRQDLDCDGSAGTDVSSAYVDVPEIRTGKHCSSKHL